MLSPCRIRRASWFRAIEKFSRPCSRAACGSWLGAWLLLRLTATTQAQELVTNGEFAYGSIEGWTLGSGAGYIGNNAGAGAAAWLTLYGRLHQDLPTTPGSAYLLRFRSKSYEVQQPPHTNALAVFWAEQRLAFYDFPALGSGWTESQFVVRAGAATTRLRFEAYWGPGLDAVSVVPLTEVPLEPRILQPTGTESFVESQDLEVLIDPQPARPDIGIASAHVYWGGTTLLGTASGDPLRWVWTNVPAGTFDLSAELVSTTGFRTRTPSVRITIEPKPKVLWDLPLPRTVFQPGETVELRAHISDFRSVIRQVVFRANDEEILRFTRWGANGLLSSPWTLPGTGNYRLTASGELDDGTPVFVDERVVHALPTGQVDQQQPQFTGTAYVYPTNDLAQVFIAGLSGRLRHVELWGGHNDGFETAPVTVSILDAPDGTPGTRVLGSTTLTFAEASRPGDDTYTSYFSFPSNDVRLVAGRHYAIVIRTHAVYQSYLQSVIVDAYPGGSLYHGSGSAWELDYAFDDPLYPMDLRFRTVMIPNRPPQVSLVAPEPLAAFQVGSPIAVEVAAADPDGQIDHVAFLANGQVLATLEAPPFVFSWTNAPPGNHLLTALAVDHLGLESVSEPVSVFVGPLADLPRLHVHDTYAPERNASLPPLVFEVTLSRTSNVPVTVDYHTANGTAIAPVDYLETMGTLTFNPGVTRAVVFVRIPADTIAEPNKRMFLTLANPTQAVLADAQAVGVIVDDDGGPDFAQGLQWELAGTNATAFRPFPVSLSAWAGDDRHPVELVGAIQLSVKGPAAESRRILGDLAATQSFETWGGVTEGYAFRPTADLLVTHLRSYAGVKVALWTDDQTLLAERVFPFRVGWLEYPLASPVTLRAGERYRLVQYTGPHLLYSRSDGAQSFEDGVIEWAYGNGGDLFPTETSPARWPLVDLRYERMTSPARRAEPGTITQFTGTRWTGTLLLSLVGEAVVLVATDDFGHTAESPPLRVTSPAGGFEPLAVVDAGVVTGPDRQTGLYRQALRLANLGDVTLPSFEATLSNLPPRIQVYGARTGPDGIHILAHPQPLAPGAVVDWVIEYFDPARTGDFSPDILWSIGATPLPEPTGEVLAVRRAERLPDGAVLVEFDAPQGRIVHVEYSADLLTWIPANWSITGAGRRVQWIDSGPPRTMTHPANEPLRYYRLRVAAP